MSMYLSFIIKNDFSGHNDVDASRKYAEEAIPLFQEFAANKVHTSNKDQCFIDDYDYNEQAVFINFACEVDIIDAKLMDGYWAFETSFDDYVLPCLGKKVLSTCRSLMSILKQNEAWICVHDHATNSITAPKDWMHWIEYAQNFDVKEITDGLLSTFDHVNYGFTFKEYYVNGEVHTLSTPIYHISL